jgi:Tfp pilus assembly protein PilN
MLDQYFRIGQLTGVHLHLGQDGNLVINACSVSANGSQLTIEKKSPGLLRIAELKDHLTYKTPLAISLSGKGVLTRQIEKIAEISQGNFNQILPNANIDDFYVQNFITGGLSFVSVIRRSEADKWINELTELGFMPLILSLGPFPVQHIISQLNVYGNEIVFNGNIIQLDEHHQWTAYRFEQPALSPFALKIETEVIDEKVVIPYAAAFQLVLAEKLEVIQAPVPELEKAFQKKITDNKIKVKGFLVLAVLFIMLLVNFILFSWLNAANALLNGQVSRFAQSTNTVQDMNDQIKKKERLLQSLGWDGGINKSALLDQLASLMPEEITWKEVAVNPVDLNSSRVQKLPIFYNRRIRITGTSDKIIPINEWLARIKTMAWVKNIQLESFAYNNELNSGQFTVIIDY